LICYVRFIHGNAIAEALALCKSITASAKAQDFVEILDTSEQAKHVVYAAMVLVLCPAVMEDWRRSFEAKALELCGPTGGKIYDSYIEPGLRICSESSKLYKDSAVEGKILQEPCEDMGSDRTSLLLHYSTSRCFLVVMYCLARLNCDKKFIFLLKRRSTNIPNIL
jgi:hypothetical protein